MPLRQGDHLPDVPLRSPDETAVSLASFRGEHTLLIFLRHLA
jgi:peroxiredoxin